MKSKAQLVDQDRNKRTSSLMPFRQAAKAFSALDIAMPIGHVKRETLVRDAQWEMTVEGPEEGRSDWFLLVKEDRDTIGWLSREDLDSALMDSVVPVTPIRIAMTVPARTPLVNMVGLFEYSYFFLLLTGNQITHVVTFQDCDRLPMKTCLFALLMELETAMTETLQDTGVSDENLLARLPEARQKKARELCQLKYPKREPRGRELLLCTTIIDKVTMITADHGLAKKLSDVAAGDVGRILKRAERLRNQIAHGDSIFRVTETPVQLHEMVVQLEQVISTLSSPVE